MDKNLLGKRIKEARSFRDCSLNDLADHIGINKSTISRYERGEIENPKLPVIDAIANYLHINPSWLIGKSEDMTFTPRNSNFTIFSPCNLFVPLKDMRRNRGLSANTVALKLGISEDDYRRIENGANVDCLTLTRLAEYFCCSTDHLLSFDGVSNEDAYYPTEKELLQKFRQLDQRGQAAVMNVVRHEFESIPGEEANPVPRQA